MNEDRSDLDELQKKANGLMDATYVMFAMLGVTTLIILTFLGVFSK